MENTDYDKVMTEMKSSLRRKLKIRNITYVSEDDLSEEIFAAIEAVNERRRFEATPSIPFETKYQRLIVNLALSNITKYGAEGETAHSENGITREYDSSGYPKELLNQIVPLAKGW